MCLDVWFEPIEIPHCTSITAGLRVATPIEALPIVQT